MNHPIHLANKQQRLLNATSTSNSNSTPPIVQINEINNSTTSISCENAFNETSGIEINQNLTFPLSDPILNDIIITFGYDAYFQSAIVGLENENELMNAALDEVKQNIFNSIIQQSLLLSSTTTRTDTTTTSTCDELLQNSIKNMLRSYYGIERRREDPRSLSDIAGYEWDYYLGFKSEPSDIIISNDSVVCQNSTATATARGSETICKTIQSSLTAQVPVDRALDANIIQSQILQHIKLGFEQDLFVTNDISTMTFVGIRDDEFTQNPTDVMDIPRFRDRVATVMSSFGISFTALLGFVAIFSFGIYVFNIARRRKTIKERSALDRAQDLNEIQQESVVKRDRATYAHPSDEGIEVVDLGSEDNYATTKEALARTLDDDGVQSGFNGLSLTAWMDSLRNDNDDSCCGSSTIDKLDLDEKEENMLLGLDDDLSLETDGHADATSSVGGPSSPSRVRSFFGKK
jgi:hypothetical protein